VVARSKQTDADGEASTQVPPSFPIKVLTASCIFVGIVALAIFLWYSVKILLLIFAGVLIAILLRGLADWVSERTKLSHAWSLAIVLVVLVCALGGVIWLSWSRLINETAQLMDRLPAALAQLHQKIRNTKIGGLLLDQAPQFDDVMSGRGNLLGSVTGVFSRTLNVIVTIMVVLITGLFLAANPRMYVRGVVHLIPPRRRDRMSEVLGAVGYTLKWWMIGQAVDMVVIGVATGIGLWLLGVPLAFVLGLITALFNFIPNFGPLFGLVPAVILALGDDPSKALYVVALFMVLQSLEGYILLPRIQHRAVHLPDAVTIVAQVLMGILAGGLGLALAAPLAASVMVAVKMLYVEDTLGDRIETPADHDAREEVREVKQAAAEVERDQK
jgi:predicted PurR-regulated permease PerM